MASSKATATQHLEKISYLEKNQHFEKMQTIKKEEKERDDAMTSPPTTTTPRVTTAAFRASSTTVNADCHSFRDLHCSKSYNETPALSYLDIEKKTLSPRRDR